MSVVISLLTMCVPFWEWLVLASCLVVALINWRRAIKGWNKALDTHNRWRGHPFYYTDERSVRRFKEGK